VTQLGGILIRYPQVHRLLNPFPPDPPTPLYGGWVDKITRISTTDSAFTPRSATAAQPNMRGVRSARQTRPLMPHSVIVRRIGVAPPAQSGAHRGARSQPIVELDRVAT